MPRLLSPKRESEFQELSGYIDFVSTHVFGLNPLDPIHPSNALNDIVKQYGKSRALQGLRQAVNDTVEQLSDKPAEYIRELDAKLRAQKLLTVSEVRRRYSSAYKRILRRAHIRGETEYYLVAGILADCSAEVAPSERSQLEQLVAAYESEA